MSAPENSHSAERTSRDPGPSGRDERGRPTPEFEAPYLRAPEGARTIFLVIFGAACGPLLGGLVFFGWRAAIVTAVAVAGCVLTERLYYRVTRVPALLGRSHAYLTGLLLALTLPPFVPWYVALIASAFAVIVGKAVFGGVGHFLWQPALVGRLAVAVMFPSIMNPAAWPVLAQNRIVLGDVTEARRVSEYDGWRGRMAPLGADAFKLKPVTEILAGLTRTRQPAFSALHVPADYPQAKEAAMMALPPINDLIYGATPGGIGESCSALILVAGLYLMYRNYVKWQLPFSFLLAAACVVAIAPIRLAAPHGTERLVWLPLLAEGGDVGFTYVNYHLFSGELLLAAMFLATETTSRPVTTGGQVIFGLGCGVIAMLLRLYVNVTVPCYAAVLAMNTFTPIIDGIWRPRVFGTRRFDWLFGRRRRK